MGIIEKITMTKTRPLQFLAALYNSIDKFIM
jgi:hypothetical protein